MNSKGLQRIVDDDFRELKPDKIGQSTDYSNTECYSRVIVKHPSGHRNLSGHKSVYSRQNIPAPLVDSGYNKGCTATSSSSRKSVKDSGSN